MLGQLTRRLPPQCGERFRRVREAMRAVFADLRPLTLDPRPMLLSEQLGKAAGSPTRNGDADTSIGPYADDIAPGGRMADEIHERINIVLRHGS